MRQSLVRIASIIVFAAVAMQGCCTQCRTEAMSCNLEQTLAAHNWQSYVGDEMGILVSIEQQELMLIKGNRIIKSYRCSTAGAGAGSLMDSYKTPTGWHVIKEKIGVNLPAGAILKDRQWTGGIWRQDSISEHSLILSRILRLEGLEEGKNRGGNVDSWDRYIYIHGTDEIDKLGKPVSTGCVRMDPQEIINLYKRVHEGCPVLIIEN